MMFLEALLRLALWQAQSEAATDRQLRNAANRDIDTVNSTRCLALGNIEMYVVRRDQRSALQQLDRIVD